MHPPVRFIDLLPCIAWMLSLFVLRWFRCTEKNGPWQHRIDWAWLISASLAGTFWIIWINGRGWFEAFPLTASDFDQYCAAVSKSNATPEDTMTTSMLRSVVAGAVPIKLGQSMGVLKALAGGSFFSTFLYCGSIYTIARLLHSRIAGGCVLAMVGLFIPLVAMPRNITFYPEGMAIAAMAAAAAMASVVQRTQTTAILAGVTAGLLALSDARGWLLMGPGIIAAFLGVFAPAPSARWRRFLCLCIPVIISWYIAHFPGVMPTSPFSDQFARYIADVERMRNMAINVSYPSKAQAFVYGSSPLTDLWPTLNYLKQLRNSVNGIAPAHDSQMASDALNTLGYLLIPAALLTAFSMRRQPLALLALSILCLPGVLGAIETAHLLPHARQFFIPLMLAPLVVGLATFAIGTPPEKTEAPAYTWPKILLRSLVQIAFVIGTGLLVQSGLNGYPLASYMNWPSVLDAQPKGIWEAVNQNTVDRSAKLCYSLIVKEREAGQDPWPWWIPAPKK